MLLWLLGMGEDWKDECDWDEDDHDDTYLGHVMKLSLLPFFKCVGRAHYHLHTAKSQGETTIATELWRCAPEETLKTCLARVSRVGLFHVLIA